MTTNDFDDRLARLTGAKKGDTVTVPDDWGLPDDDVTLGVDRELLRDIERRDVFVNDGSGDQLPWHNETHGYTWTVDLARLGLDVDAPAPAAPDLDALAAVPEGYEAIFAEPTRFPDGANTLGCGYGTEFVAARRAGKSGHGEALFGLRTERSVWLFEVYAEQIAALGLTADDFTAPDAADEPSVTVTGAVPYRVGGILGDFSDETWAGPADDGSGTAILDVVPDTDAFRDAVRKVSERPAATEERVDEPDVPVPGEPRVWLDEFQQERVAALEHAIRLLESRRNSDGPATKLFGVETARIVSARDMITVARFIVEGEVPA